MGDPEENALSLFSGGPDGVKLRMAKAVKDTLASKESVPGFLDWFKDEFEVDEKALGQLQKGDQDIDIRLFEKLQETLDISFHDVLGEPSFRNGAKEFWLGQQCANPMILTGPIKEPSAPNDTRGGKEAQERELKLYVRLCAINELVLG